MLKLDLNLLWTVVDVLILYVLLRKFLFKPIQMILAKRQTEVDSTYEEAAQATLDAETAKADYEERLLTAHAEAEKITTRALESAKDSSAALLKEAEKESAALRERASRDIALERRKAMNDAKGEISALAVEIAAKVVKKEISPEQHEALFEQFIDELGDDV